MTHCARISHLQLPVERVRNFRGASLLIRGVPNACRVCSESIFRWTVFALSFRWVFYDPTEFNSWLITCNKQGIWAIFSLFNKDILSTLVSHLIFSGTRSGTRRHRTRMTFYFLQDAGGKKVILENGRENCNKCVSALLKEGNPEFRPESHTRPREAERSPHYYG